MKKYKGIIECPRWMNFETELKNYCWASDIHIVVDVDKSLFRKNIRFIVESEDNKIDQFIIDINNVLVELGAEKLS